MKSRNPTVSVLLPIGKDKRFLKEALESIRLQSFKDYELLSKEDDGRGMTKVLIELAKKAKGEFLARMDADDICDPKRLEVQVDYLRSHPDVQLIGSWAILIDEKGDRIGLQKMPVDWEGIKKDAFHRNPLIHSSWMMRKSWYERVGGYEPSFFASQDWELLLRRVWHEEIENIPEFLIKLRIHSGSVSFSKNRLQVYSGLKARLSAIFRGDVSWYKAIYLIPSALALIIPPKIKLLARLNVISANHVIPARFAEASARRAKAGIYLNRFRVKSFDSELGTVELHGMTMRQTLGIVMPIGQNKQQLLKSGQWSLWQSEIEEYQKNFDRVEVFEYKHQDWRRFPEAMFLPFIQSARFKQCLVLKAVHLTGSIPCLIAKLMCKKPFVLSFGYRYDEFAKIEKKWLQWIFMKLLEPLAVRFADLVLVPTEELKVYVEKSGAKNVEVIPNGVDTEIFKGLALPRQGQALSDLCVLFVGRFEEQKNLKTLIGAVSRIFKGQALINIQFVGDGSQKKELVELADKLGVNLKIIGPISNEKLPAIYHQADIFVLPSLVEGHPKALLEAMSCGLACIATDISGPREIIINNQNGLLVQPTEDGLAEGLERLIGDSGLRQRLGMNARKTVLDKYNKKKLMERESELY